MFRSEGGVAMHGLIRRFAMVAGAATLSAGAAAGTVVTTGTAAQAASSCTTSGTTTTCTYTGAGTYSFAVPAGVTAVNVKAVGAAGGIGADFGGGAGPGASVQDTAVPVSAYQGQMLTVIVGGVGGAGSIAAQNATVGGGGPGGTPGGGGAGGSGVFGAGGGGGYSGLLDLSGTALVIAGGGGGSGFANAAPDPFTGGAGDTGSGGGAGQFQFTGCPSSDPDSSLGCGGGGGTSTAGGTGGAGGTQFRFPQGSGGTGSNGAKLTGGQGAPANYPDNPSTGGGGGGGYFGGGGGGSGDFGGGGGGGSSFGAGPGLTNESTATTAASVTISYQNVLSIASHPNITVNATSKRGATVTYTAPAVTDSANPANPPAAVCTPPAGSTFPIGTTTVTCTATDPQDANSPVSTTFTVTVVGAVGQLAALDQAVSGFGAGLANTVLIAERAVATGNTPMACLALSSFIIQVETHSPPLPGATAAQLVADAAQIRAVLGC
jgi:HYR domain